MWDRFLSAVGITLVVIFLVVLSLQVVGVLGTSPNETECPPNFVNDC